jgi:hypothetical protein
MYTALSVTTSLRTPLKIPLSSEGLPIACLATEAKLSLAIKLKKAYEHSVSTNGKVNRISTTKILQNDDTRPLIMLQTLSLIVLVHPHTYGYFAYSIFTTY